MSTLVEVDDGLVRRAVEQSGLASAREAIEEALRVFIRLQAQRALVEMFGKFPVQAEPETQHQEHP